MPSTEISTKRTLKKRCCLTEDNSHKRHTRETRLTATTGPFQYSLRPNKL